VLALNQRGYSPGARPLEVSAYRPETLAGDVIAMLDAAGVDRAHVVGHDWGGAVAWRLAGDHPDRLRTVASFSTPHPLAMRRALLSSTQALRSWYMAVIQIPGLPERGMLAGGGRMFKRNLVGMGLDPAIAEQYVERMRQPGALTAALNWYRTMRGFQVPPSTVPTLYVWSTKDAALGRRAAEATAEFVRAPYRFEVLEGVSHWIPEEVPDRVAALVLEHIRS
jgi:pimeloyl-ACP methyl ester carboxylesterase